MDEKKRYNPRENFLKALRHEPTDYTPAGFVDNVSCGLLFEPERGPLGGGYDGFGVRWVAPHSALGGALPAPGEFLLDDVTKWKEKVQIPDLKSVDWEGMARIELANVDREASVVEVINTNCVFERLAALMGFEEALVAMFEEPDAVNDLFAALIDYKIETVKYYAKYYQPDIFTYFDDIATEQNLFMSPKTYRELIKPHHTRLVQAIKDEGIIPVQHTCGKADTIIQDIIETGTAAWSSVQPTNDIEGIIERYGDVFTLIGGYNTNGAPGFSTATEEEIRVETRRCLERYGRFGKGFIFVGIVVIEGGPDDFDKMFDSIRPMQDEIMKERRALGYPV